MLYKIRLNAKIIHRHIYDFYITYNMMTLRSTTNFLCLTIYYELKHVYMIINYIEHTPMSIDYLSHLSVFFGHYMIKSEQLTRYVPWGS